MSIANQRLLYVTTVVNMAERFLLPYASHYRERGWQVDAVANGITDSVHAVRAFNHCYDIEWSRNPLHLWNFIRAPHTLRRLVKNVRYDIVHVHSPVAAFVTRLALGTISRKHRPVVIYSAHGFHFHPSGGAVRNTVFRILEKVAAPWTDWLVTVNRVDTDAASRLKLVPQDRLVFIPGFGIDRSVFSAESIDAESAFAVRLECDIPVRAPLLLSAAAYIPRKRPLDVINAFARADIPSAHLAMAGHGPMEAEMKELATRLGVADRVHVIGFRRDIHKWMSTSDGLVLASEHEGRPQSIMEAMCLGKPVIGSDIRGTQDLLRNGGGVLFPVGDIDSLANAMELIVTHPSQALKIGREAAKNVAEYDIGRILTLHDNLYDQALSDRNGI